MAKITFSNSWEGFNEYDFDLLPTIHFSKMVWGREKNFDLYIGLWFWSLAISWESPIT